MAREAIELVSGGWHQCDPSWDRWAGEWQEHDKWYFPVAGEAFYDAGDGPVRIAPGRVWLLPGRRSDD